MVLGVAKKNVCTHSNKVPLTGKPSGRFATRGELAQRATPTRSVRSFELDDHEVDQIAGRVDNPFVRA